MQNRNQAVNVLFHQGVYTLSNNHCMVPPCPNLDKFISSTLMPKEFIKTQNNEKRNYKQTQNQPLNWKWARISQTPKSKLNMNFEIRNTHTYNFNREFPHNICHPDNKPKSQTITMCKRELSTIKLKDKFTNFRLKQII